jgi:hypothetical protein
VLVLWEMTPEESRTHHASQAANVSDLINLKFANKTYGTETKRYLRATEPDGPSTDGGRKARQALMLLTKHEMATGGGIVCGFVDITSFIAEIRTHQVVSSHFSQRFHKPFDLSKGEYDRMQADLDQYLKGQGFQTRLATTPQKRSASTTKSAPNVAPLERKRALWMKVAPIAGAFVGGFSLCYLLVRFGLL